MAMHSLLSILGGLVLLIIGAESLVRGSVLLAYRLRISPLVVGLTVVAFGTSAPELVVSVRAALSGSGDIALGNVVGSNIANVLLILGVAACIRPMHVESRVVRIDIPIMIGVSILVLPLLANGQVSRVEGGCLLLGIVTYTGLAIWLSRREPNQAALDLEKPPEWPRPVAGQVALIVLGLSLLVWGAGMLVGGATEVAQVLGVSEAVIGLTIVALGTSLPELVTSIVAAVKNHSDIAVGNVVGSNIFNLLGIVGASALVRPLASSGIAGLDYGVMIVAALVLLPLAWTHGRLMRWEGVLLLVGYGGYVSYRAGLWQ